jgi:hypothetical protein
MTAHACFLVSCPMSVAVEAKITRLRSEQHVRVRELEYGQAPQSDGSRTMVDYVQSRLDIKRDTARDLVFPTETTTVIEYRPRGWTRRVGRDPMRGAGSRSLVSTHRAYLWSPHQQRR